MYADLSFLRILPEKLVIRIFSYLKKDSLINVRITCRKAYALANKNFLHLSKLKLIVRSGSKEIDIQVDTSKLLSKLYEPFDLETLSICYNKDNKGPVSWSSVVKGFVGMPPIKVLKLSWLVFSGNEIESMTTPFPNVQHLQLTNCTVSPETLALLPKSITRLTLRNCAGTTTPVNIAKTVENLEILTPVVKIKSLFRWRRCNTIKSLTLHHALDIPEDHFALPISIEHLDIREHNFRDDFLEEIARLKKIQTLKISVQQGFRYPEECALPATLKELNLDFLPPPQNVPAGLRKIVVNKAFSSRIERLTRMLPTLEVQM